MQQPNVQWRVQVIRLHVSSEPTMQQWDFDTWAEVEEWHAKYGRLTTAIVTAVSPTVAFSSEIAQTAAKAAYHGVMSGPCANDPCFGDRAGAEE